MEILFLAGLGWGVFWTVYYLGSLGFDWNRRKTRFPISSREILSQVFQNTWVTGLFQPVWGFLFPWGIWDPSFVLLRFLLSLFLFEILFYYLHRLFHLPRFYPYHQEHHLFVEPCALAALYCSKTEAVLVNQLAISVGPIVTGMGVWEVMGWSALAALNVLKAHSGLRYPYWNSAYHDIHHQKKTVNFGFLYFLDWLHGTCRWPKREIPISKK